MVAGEIPKKQSNAVVDSRFVKIVAAKKQELQDALIFVCLREQKYGHLDKGQLRKVVEMLEKVAPDSVWFGATKDYTVTIIDRKELKNKDLLITLRYEEPDLVDQDFIEDSFRRAIPEANDIQFVHHHGSMDLEIK